MGEHSGRSASQLDHPACVHAAQMPSLLRCSALAKRSPGGTCVRRVYPGRSTWLARRGTDRSWHDTLLVTLWRSWPWCSIRGSFFPRPRRCWGASRPRPTIRSACCRWAGCARCGPRPCFAGSCPFVPRPRRCWGSGRPLYIVRTATGRMAPGSYARMSRALSCSAQ
jgi:hypothetical protein